MDHNKKKSGEFFATGVACTRHIKKWFAVISTGMKLLIEDEHSHALPHTFVHMQSRTYHTHPRTPTHSLMWLCTCTHTHTDILPGWQQLKYGHVWTRLIRAFVVLWRLYMFMYFLLLYFKSKILGSTLIHFLRYSKKKEKIQIQIKYLW